MSKTAPEALLHPPTTIASPLALTIIAVTLGYIATCVIWPFGPCRRCHGAGKLRAPIGRFFRLCPRCHGAGRRIRTGRHLWNHWRRIHRDGTR